LTRTNKLVAGKILKQIERSFEDLHILEARAITFEMFNDLLFDLGYASNDLYGKERIIKDSWK